MCSLYFGNGDANGLVTVNGEMVGDTETLVSQLVPG